MKSRVKYLYNWETVTQIEILCREVGKFQCHYFRRPLPGKVLNKGKKSYVSEIDQESEERLRDGLQQLIPEAGFYGEESGHSGDRTLFWLVDPLDGTTNYLSGLEHFTISVALIEVDRPVLGLVYKPMTEEVFTAIAGQGARYNRQTLNKVQALPLNDAVIGIGFPYREADIHSKFIDCTANILRAVRDIRCQGSAALELSYVAAGFYQGFWDHAIQPYDVAAATVLLSETGCLYSSYTNKPYNLLQDHAIIAGHPDVYEALHNIVSRYYQSL